LKLKRARRFGVDDEPDSDSSVNITDFLAYFRKSIVNDSQISSGEILFRKFDNQSIGLNRSTIEDIDNKDVFKISYRHDWLDLDEAWDLGISATKWGQRRANSLDDIYADDFRAFARFTYDRNLSDRLTSRFSTWLRNVNEDLSDFTNIDPDVWSEYKDNHQRGISLSQRWARLAALDSQIYGEARVSSNEDYLSVDQGSLRVGLQQYYKTLSLHSNLRWRRFEEDDDRIKSFDQTDLNARLNWLVPTSRESALNLELDARYNFDQEELALWVSIGWFNHASRQLKDFRRGEYLFREPRQAFLESPTSLKYKDRE